MTWQAAHIQAIPDFMVSNNILEVGAGDFLTSIFLARKFPDKCFYALDFAISRISLQNIIDTPSNFFLIKADACDLSFLSKNFFDFAFSIAVAEHIHDMQRHLSEMFRLLIPYGKYFFWASPLWSCSIGHHLHHLPQYNEVIPYYSHLYMNESQMKELLINKGISPDYVLEKIYFRQDLSRLKYSEYIDILNNSQFTVKKLETEPDLNCSKDLYQPVLDNNLFDVSEEEFSIKEIKVLC